jgi:hypothetical protein
MNELVRWDPFKAVAPFEDSFLPSRVCSVRLAAR